MYCDAVVGMLAGGRARDMAGLTGGGRPEGLFDPLTDSNMGKAYDWDHVLRIGEFLVRSTGRRRGKPSAAEKREGVGKKGQRRRRRELAAADKDWKRWA